MILKCKNMKKYTIEFTEEQLSLMARCIEDIHRFAAGDMELHNTISVLLQDDKDRAIKKQLLNNLFIAQKQVIYPNMSIHETIDYAGNGIENDVQRYFIANTYQLYREIYHITAEANDLSSCYRSDTLQGGNIGRPKLILL